jgi:hypothetical protein
LVGPETKTTHKFEDTLNKKTFSVALMASALPLLASASSVSSLGRGDFISSEKNRNGRTVVSVKLSKSGKAKLRRLQSSK